MKFTLFTPACPPICLMTLGVKEKLRGGFMLLRISGCFVWANLFCLIKTVFLILCSAFNLRPPSDNFLFRNTLEAEPIVSYFFSFVEH